MVNIGEKKTAKKRVKIGGNWQKLIIFGQ